VKELAAAPCQLKGKPLDVSISACDVPVLAKLGFWHVSNPPVLNLLALTNRCVSYAQAKLEPRWHTRAWKSLQQRSRPIGRASPLPHTYPLAMRPLWHKWPFSLSRGILLPRKHQTLHAQYAGQFRTQVAGLSVKEPAAAPQQLKGKPLGASISAGNLPTLAQLGLQPVSCIPGTPHARGGADTSCAHSSQSIQDCPSLTDFML